MAKLLAGRFFFVLVVAVELWATPALSRELQEQLSMKDRHEKWMSTHGRIYKDDAEKARRLEIFKNNVEFIEAFNRDGDRSYTLGTNEFSDMTNEEFQAVRNGYKKSPLTSSRTTPFKYGKVSAVPASMDWRKKGAVTPVKDQQQCGCCWAFSAVAAMEGITQLTTGKLISLSEQELVDCDVNGEDQGCEGGLMDKAFQFIIGNHGLTTEANYPYEGIDGTCKRSKEANHVASITGFEDVPTNDEAALLKAAAHQPISVAIDASGSEFMSYSGGIFSGPCGTNLDHGVTVVGYGTTADGTKYWLVKNSWGESWGESGYIRMKRDEAAAEGLCGIAMQASYPTA